MYRTIIIVISILIVLLLGGTFISTVRERARSEVLLSSTPVMFEETLEPTVQADANDVQTSGEILPKAINTVFLPIIRADVGRETSESIPE